MSVEVLLREFERLAEATNAVSRLRRFVLDLAVRGRLVPQRRSDGRASGLLEQIAAEKATLTSRRKTETLSTPDGYPAPFALPVSWEWVRLSDVVTKLTDGTHHSPANLPEGPFKYITAKNIKAAGVSLREVSYVAAEVQAEIYARCDPALGDVLYVKDGATTGVVTINDLDEPFSMLSSVALLKLPSGVFNRLLVAFLRSPFFYDQMRGQMKGSALPRVTLTRMAPALLPLPPLAEQHRIVAKVDELMALCDRLEEAQAERETRRDALRWASGQRLTATPANGPASRGDVKFFLTHSGRLVTKPAHVAAVRKHMVDLAVRGRLVPQDEREGSAPELLSAIERRRASTGSRPPRTRPAIRGSGVEQIGLPSTWTWVALSDVCDSVTDGDHQPPPKTPSGVPFLVIGNVREGRVNFAGSRHVPPEYYASLDDFHRPKRGDLLYTLVGSYGMAIAVDRDEPFCVQRHIGILRPAPEVDQLYLQLALSSSGSFQQATECATGVAQKTVSLRGLRQLLVPLPPLAEQRRIVAKVEGLGALCDELGLVVAKARVGREQLLEALLADTLANGGVVAPQAA